LKKRGQKEGDADEEEGELNGERRGISGGDALKMRSKKLRDRRFKGHPLNCQGE